MGHFEQERNYLAAEQYIRVAGLLASQAITRKVPKLPKFVFSVDSDYAVVGHDGEFADMDNPRGEIVQEIFYMVATDREGRQYRYGREASADKAEEVFQLFAPAVELWPYFRSAYGSAAYVQDNCEAAQIRWELDSELGPDYQNHPHVRGTAYALLG